MRNSAPTLAAALVLLCCVQHHGVVQALSSEAASLSRGRVFEALASPSGKLTIAPEIVIPDPSDPTAILLQTNAISTLSERIRTAKGNSAWISGSANAVRTFCQEQENARGNFPGPLPVIYCPTTSADSVDPTELADAGASAVVVPLFGGKELESIDQISADNEWVGVCQKTLECGMQPIPEITIGDAMAAGMMEEDVEKLVQAVSAAAGSDPVSVLFTMNPADDEQELVSLPKVPKALGKKIPIIGSIRVTAGDNRLGLESQRFKEAGFTGAVMRSDCVPGFRMNPDLEIVGLFWSDCISDLKSTRSKNFEFNSRNNMEKNGAQEWANYQQGVIESGALGDPDDAYSVVDDSVGEYKGFA